VQREHPFPILAGRRDPKGQPLQHAETVQRDQTASRVAEGTGGGDRESFGSSGRCEFTEIQARCNTLWRDDLYLAKEVALHGNRRAPELEPSTERPQAVVATNKNTS
jgi:hypothetical protein